MALLRGINVGRNKRLAMADLRLLLETMGLTQVTTLLQSGNALFSSPRTTAEEVAGMVEQEISSKLGLEVSVVVRTVEELVRLVAQNPLPDAAAEPSRFHLTFLSEDPAIARIETIDPAAYAPDEFAFGDRAIYVWYRSGVIESKLTNQFWEKRLGVIATARNWNTVTRLVALSRG